MWSPSDILSEMFVRLLVSRSSEEMSIALILRLLLRPALLTGLAPAPVERHHLARIEEAKKVCWTLSTGLDREQRFASLAATNLALARPTPVSLEVTARAQTFDHAERASTTLRGFALSGQLALLLVAQVQATLVGQHPRELYRALRRGRLAVYLDGHRTLDIGEQASSARDGARELV